MASIATEIEKTGQYTPYIEVGNYYIFDSNFTGGEVNANEPMILAHVLPHVKNPVTEFPIARGFVTLMGWLGLNRQPADGEFYLNPIFGGFSFLFGSDWVQGPLVVVRLFNFHDQSLTPSSTPSFKPSISSYSTYSPSSSSSSSSYSNSYGNSFTSSSCIGSTSGGCERQRQDRMKALGLTVSIIQETILF